MSDFLIGVIIGFFCFTLPHFLAPDKEINPNEYSRYEKICKNNGGVKVISATKKKVTCNNGGQFDYSLLYHKHVVDSDPPTYDILEDATVK